MIRIVSHWMLGLSNKKTPLRKVTDLHKASSDTQRGRVLSFEE